MKACPSCRSPKEDPINVASVSTSNTCSECGWVWQKSLMETVVDNASGKIGQLRGTLKSSFNQDQPAGVPVVAAPARVPFVLTATAESEDLGVLEFREGPSDPDKVAMSVEDELATWGDDVDMLGAKAQVLAYPGKVVTPVEDPVALWMSETLESEAITAAREDVQGAAMDALDFGLLDGSSLRSGTDQWSKAEQTSNVNQKVKTVAPIVDVWRSSAPIQAATAVAVQMADAVDAVTVAPSAHLSSDVRALSPVQSRFWLDATPPPVQDPQRLTASVDRTLQNVDDLCDVFARLQQQLAGLERSCEALIGTAA